MSAQQSITLDLGSLGAIGRVSPGFAVAMAEAASVCFEGQDHKSGTSVTVQGAFGGGATVTWSPTTISRRASCNGPLVQHRSRLEVSRVPGGVEHVKVRADQKRARAAASDSTNATAIVGIVKSGSPTSHVETRP